jgi:hypothetical protein
MKKAAILLLSMSFFLINCNDDSEPIIQEIPECYDPITDKIAQTPKEELYYPTNIYSYMYNDQKVLVIPQHITNVADAANLVIDLDCQTICHYGGFAGNTCPDFLSIATDKTLFWEDPR